MSYRDAEDTAGRARRAAGGARSYAKTEYERQMADALSQLAKAVEHMAEQLRKDN